MHLTDPFVGVVLDGRYELLEPLGAGGMGLVYRGWQIQVEREVAVKLLRPAWRAGGAHAELEERFRREASALARLRHPGIVRIFDAGVSQHGLFLVMELAEGRTLRDRLDAEGPLPAEEVRALGTQLAEALSHAHDAGIHHRDLKPANVVLSGGEAQLLDFGIALLAHQTRLTVPDQTLGTVAYMAPERFSAPETADHRVDLYALGVVLYEALCGALPFDSTDLLALRVQIQAGTCAPLPRDIPEPLRGTVAALMSPEPSQRPQTAAEVAERLRQGTTTTHAAPARRHGLFAAGLGLAAVLAAGSLALPRSWPQPTPQPEITLTPPEPAPVPEPEPEPEPAPVVVITEAAPPTRPAPRAPGRLRVGPGAPAQLRAGGRVIADGQEISGGDYDVWADFGSGWALVRQVSLRGGGDVRVRCSPVRLECSAEEGR